MSYISYTEFPITVLAASAGAKIKRIRRVYNVWVVDYAVLWSHLGWWEDLSCSKTGFINTDTQTLNRLDFLDFDRKSRVLSFMRLAHKLP